MEEAYRAARISDSNFSLRFRKELRAASYTRRPIQSSQRCLISDFVTVRERKSRAVNFNRTRLEQTNIRAVNPYRFCDGLTNNLGQIASKSLTVNLRPKQRNLIRAFNLRIKMFGKLQVALLSLAVAMLALGGYATLVGINDNHAVQVQAAKLTQQANMTTKNGSNSPTVPSTIKPTAATVSSFTVAPDLPKYLIIPKLGVNAEIRSVGLTNSGALGVPDNVYYTDWYDESALPGQQGAMLIDGHVSSWTAQGVFYSLKTLVSGDIIEVQRGDNIMFTYKVVKSQVYPSGNVDMAAAMTPIVSGQPGLNLITCTGDVVPGTSTFNERIIVFATQVSVS